MSRRGLLSLSCLALLAPVAAPAHASDPGPHCARVIVSNVFSRDHTAYCIGGLGGGYAGPHAWGGTRGVEVWRTTTAGRTWEPRSSFASELEQHDGVDGVLDGWAISAGDEHALYLSTGSGLYVSVDGAKTYHLVDSKAVPQSFHYGLYGFYRTPLTPFLGTFQPAAGVPAVAGTLFAYAGDDTPSAIVDAGHDAHIPVAGGGPGTEDFLLPPDFGKTGSGFALVGNPNAGSPTASKPVSVMTLYACPAALTCVQKLATFPANRDIDRIWLAPDFATSKRILAVTRPAAFSDSSDRGQDVTAMESTDGGATFHAWASVDKLLAPARAQHAEISVDLATGTYGNTMYASLTTYYDGPGYPSVPQEQLFRSTDAGRSWHRVAYASWNRTEERPAIGNLPFWPSNGSNYVYSAGAAFALANDGTLFGTGSPVASYGGQARVFCSRDGGAHWSRACPR